MCACVFTLSDSVSKVMCAHALCWTLFVEKYSGDFVGKMCQVHGKCEDNHTGGRGVGIKIGKRELAAAYDQKPRKENWAMPPFCLFFPCSALNRVTGQCPCPSCNGGHMDSPSSEGNVRQVLHIVASLIIQNLMGKKCVLFWI